MALPKWGCHFLYVRCDQANILLQTRSRLDGRIAVLRRQNTPPKYRWVHTVWSSILPDLRSFTPNKRVHFVSITLGDVVAKAVAASTDKLHENLLSFLSFYGWQKDLLAGIFFWRLGLGAKATLLRPTIRKLPVPGRANGVSWDPKGWLKPVKSELLSGRLGLGTKGVLLWPTTGKSPVPGRSIVSFETQKPASAPTFLSILWQNNCKASEDFVYASCSCGALSEARRAELAGAAANRRINKIRKRSLFWNNIR